MIYILTNRGLSNDGPIKGDQVVLEQFLNLSLDGEHDVTIPKVISRFSLVQFVLRINWMRLFSLQYSFRSLLCIGFDFEKFSLHHDDKIVVIGHYLSSIFVDTYPNIICHLIDNEHKKNSSYPWYFFVHRIEGLLYRRELDYMRSRKKVRFLYVTLKDSLYRPNEFSLPLFKNTSSLSITPELRDPFKLVFWGNLDYIPNLLAVRWLCANLADLERSGFSLRIIGKSTRKSTLRLLRNSGVDYRGYVVDLRQEVSDCGLFVAPMWSGSGIQNKVLEAISFGMPCLISDYLSNQFEWNVSSFISVSDKVTFLSAILHHTDTPQDVDKIVSACENFDRKNSMKHYENIFMNL